jgi:hypothetical protein
VIDYNTLSDRDRDHVRRCADCRVSDGKVAPCGWYENLQAATAVVERLAKGVEGGS